MASITPYIGFSGRCREAMTFYQECLGGSLDFKTFEGTPMENAVPEEARDGIMHSTLIINGSPVLMASDGMGCSEGKQEAPTSGNIALSLNFNSEADIDAAFGKIAAGGIITMPLANQFWGAKFGKCTDKFNIEWMFHFDNTASPIDDDRATKKAREE